MLEMIANHENQYGDHGLKSGNSCAELNNAVLINKQKHEINLDSDVDVEAGSNIKLNYGLSSNGIENSKQSSIKMANATRLPQQEILNQTPRGVDRGVEVGPSVPNLHAAQLLEDDNDDELEEYSRFYFESDHLALKDNKHYHLLLQTLLVLESQRNQAIKDLDVLCEQQAKALQDPIAFVEKLQENEPLGLPSHQRVVKLPSVPWEEYSVSLSPLDRQKLNNPHHTRKATQNLDKAPPLAPQSSDVTNAVPVSSESNMYSVFGGEFVASKHGKPLEREGLMSVLGLRSEAVNGKLSRGRLSDETKPVTYNQQWTTEEQAKLEKLLQIYPQEEVEAKRWEKIALALGNRTLKQVASRVQKYFIKLARAGLPVPGRVPNVPRPGVRSKRAHQHYQTLGFRNSTFFPSYQPRVLMDDEDDISSVATDDTAGYLSDEESVPADLRDSEEYRELMELKRVKRQKIGEHHQESEEPPQHNGFMCDSCGMNPIRGTRWHCPHCPQDNSVDFCSACFERGNVTMGAHTAEHTLEPVTRSPSDFIDGDYLGLSGASTSAGYNYLDPNFLPAAS